MTVAFCDSTAAAIERRGDRLDISRSHDDPLYAITHNIACFACGDLWQGAGSRFIGDFGATFPLGGKHVHRPLAEILLEIAHKSPTATVIALKFLEIRLCFIVHRTNKPQFGVWEFEAVPCLKQMMNALALNQCSGKNRPKFRRRLPRPEAVHIYTA